jgi:signal transduction histidine kinase
MPSNERDAALSDERTHDREETDSRLRQERARADHLAGRAAPAGERVIEVVSDRRHDASCLLDGARDRGSAPAQPEQPAAILPLVSERLEEVAGSLSQAAASLNSVADTIKESLSPVDIVENLAQVAQEAADTAQQLSDPRSSDAPPPRAVSAQLAGQLAEIAEGMAAVTSTLAEERLDVDEALHGARAQTDDALARERRNTDEAVEHVVTLLDETEEQREAAERTAATRNEFLQIVSHDLRGPLMTIGGAAALIEQHAAASASAAEIRDWADTIRRSVGVMDRLIRDLLDFGSFEDGQLRVSAVAHDIRGLVSDVVAAFAPVAGAKSVCLLAELPDAPVIAVYDHHRMLQVLSNLVHNAVKFTPSGGTIHVRAMDHTTSSSRECLLSVADTGIGVPQGELRSIFERFRRLDVSDRTGLGLGLYISQWIVDAHGGRIWAESDLGAGTTVHVTLPSA